MSENEIVILSGARTAIGTFGGSLAGVPPIQLAATVTRAAIERAGVASDRIGTVVFGHVLNTEPRDMYLSRVAMLDAGVPDTTPAMNVNRLCGSGAQAIVSATQALMLGDADFAVAGGAESMSRAPYAVPAARFGAKMGDVQMLDMMVGALTCPMGTGHMGVTAENVAREHDISRQAQDAFALFARGTDLLAFDAQYRPEEYAAHKGWGHSAWTDAAEAARRCGARKLWLMHHAPGRTDAELDAMAAKASAMFKEAVFPTVETMTEILHE